MKLDFRSQTIQNFKAFVGKHEFSWTVPGVTLIRGENQSGRELESNGASKSSLFDAFCWCLFGRTASGLRNPDVVPWRGAVGPTSVEQCIHIDGKVHTIRRTVSPNRLLFDDEDIDQEKLDAELGLNFSLLTNTILVAQDCPLFFDRTPEKKMELFSEALELDRWDTRAESAGLKQTAAEGNATWVQTKIETTTAALVETGKLLSQTQASSEDWAAKVRKNKRDSQEKIADLEKQLEPIQKQYDDALLKEEGAGVELVALRAKADALLKASTTRQATLDKARTKLNEAQALVTSYLAELAKLQKTKTCPTCGQLVKPADLQQHIQQVTTKLAAAEKVVAVGLPTELNGGDSDTAAYKQATTHIAEFVKKEAAARAVANRLQFDVVQRQTEIKSLRRQLTLEAAENPFVAQIKELQARQKELAVQVAQLDTDLSTALAQAEQYKFWRRGFKDIKLQLVDEVLGELEVATNGMLEEVGLVGWEVRYDIERETKSGSIKRALHVEIRSPESKGFVKWESWSGGERQRLKLVGTLALSDVLLSKAGVAANLEILDEPALYWSAAGVHDLCAFLSDRARETKRSIFFVEHSASESAHFSKVVTVVKDRKGAYIAD